MKVQTTSAGQTGLRSPVPARVRRMVHAAAAALLVAGAFACNSATDAGKLPPEIADPTTLRTPAGAVARYRGAFKIFGRTMDPFVIETGVLTDEMADLAVPFGVSGSYTGIDSRTDLRNFEKEYNGLHRLRAEAREARGFLTAYAPDSSTALSGHLYAVEAYADILLADLFCSGIPLSTVEFDGNYTLQPGSTTAEVYSAALALFDSATGLVSDSVRLQHFTAVGRGRALLALSRYREAAAAVTDVPDDYQYVLPATIDTGLSALRGIFVQFTTLVGRDLAAPSIGNVEGINGLNYRTSADPRISMQAVGSTPDGQTLWFPTQYPYREGQLTENLILASGIEARLIEAEADLQANPGDGLWLAKLNALRTDGTFETPDPNGDPGNTDTLWHAGGGGVAGLAPLADPGTETGRVDLLFRERAFWLFLTGHRQGDLRRLVRDYGRSPNATYPTGGYAGGNDRYGDQYFAPVPASERTLNPEYLGCLS